MKKEYINPQLEVVLMNTMTVLAASDRSFSSDEATSDGNGYYNEASQFFDNGGSEDW